MKTKFFTLKRLSLSALILASSTTVNAQARVQIIHNSPDAATQTVDTWAGNALLLDDFEFRTASPFVNVPAGTIQIGIAPPSSTMASQSLAFFPLTVANGETYIAIANGILNSAGYAPAPSVSVDVFALGQEEATTMGNTDVLVFHGSTDAPAVDVSTPGGMTPLVDDAGYGNYAGYLNLPTADYVLNVTDASGMTVVRSYEAPLSSLGLGDSALVVVASGFLDPSMNSNGEEFGLWVALPEGGDLIELPKAEARIQVIHNSADALAATVDVYLNGALLIDDFDFRTASSFIDIDAEVENTIDIAPANSTGVGQSVATVPVTLSTGETYVAIANGILSATGYSPAPAFSLDVYNMGQETSNMAGNTDVLVFHGSTDAPTVDINEATAGNLVDNASYGDFAGYLELMTNDYIIEVRDQAGTAILFSYSAPLASLSLTNSAIVVLASGFVDPSVNSNGAGFGLWAAVPTGGALVELPAAFASVTEFNKDLNVFPNPSSESIQVQGIENGSDLIITDLSGRILEQRKINNGEVVSTSFLANGTYLLTISFGDNFSLIKHTVKQ